MSETYKRAQVHELEWWTDNPIDMSEEWRHYLVHLGPTLKRERHAETCIDVGSGPIPFFCSPAISCNRTIAVDPLIDEYAEIAWAQKQVTRDFERVKNIYDLGIQISDMTFCLNTLDHVEDPYGLLRACANVTKIGGLLVVTVDLEKEPDVYHPSTIKERTIVSALGRYTDRALLAIDRSWKFENDVLWWAGWVR